MPGPYQITVGYNPDAILQWTFDPWDLNIPANATFPVPVTMTRAGTNFTFVQVLDLNSPQWTGTNAPTNGGTTMSLVEHNKQNGHNPYQVVINVNGQRITSPTNPDRAAVTTEPPMIINDGLAGKRK